MKIIATGKDKNSTSEFKLDTINAACHTMILQPGEKGMTLSYDSFKLSEAEIDAIQTNDENADD